MSREKSKTYTAEFRASAVKLANESDKPIAKEAKDLGFRKLLPHSENRADTSSDLSNPS